MAKRGGGGGGKIPEVVEGTVKKFIKKADVKTPHGSTPHTPGGPTGPRSRADIVEAGKSKVPSTWGDGTPNTKGVGQKWVDPQNPGNRVRIDQGNPQNSQLTQQIDHVQVNSGGRVIGRDGNPIEGTVKDNYEQAHVPLDDWLRWQDWNRP